MVGSAETMIRVHFGERLSPTAIQPQIDVSAKYAGFSTFPAQDIIAPGLT